MLDVFDPGAIPLRDRSQYRPFVSADSMAGIARGGGGWAQGAQKRLAANLSGNDG
jgi:hypothetical protein